MRARHSGPHRLSTANRGVDGARRHPFRAAPHLPALLSTAIVAAALETALSGTYNVRQFFNREWGKNPPARDVPVFTVGWLGMLALAAADRRHRRPAGGACQHLDHFRDGRHAVSPIT